MNRKPQKNNGPKNNETDRSKKSLAEGLSQVKKNNLPPSPGSWEGDGVDHICVDSQADTELGRALAARRDINWEHPVLGYFKTFENLWLFLSVAQPHDELRRLHLRDAREFARNVCGGLSYYPNIEAVYLDSIYRYIKTRNNLCEMLKKSELPFDIYYRTPAGVCVRRSPMAWLSEGFEEIREALRNDREPDLSRWTTRNDEHIYHDIMVALGSDSTKTLELFKKAVSEAPRDNRKTVSRPKEKNNGRVKERLIKEIDPVVGFSVKVRGQGEVAEDPFKVLPLTIVTPYPKDVVQNMGGDSEETNHDVTSIDLGETSSAALQPSVELPSEDLPAAPESELVIETESVVEVNQDVTDVVINDVGIVAKSDEQVS